MAKTLEIYDRGVKILNETPQGEGGKALNNNFQAIVDDLNSLETEVDNKIENISEDSSPTLGGDLDANGNQISNLADPTLSQDAATKAYVDSISVSSSDLEDLNNVIISSITDNEVLAYDNGSGKWINQTAAEAGLAEAVHNHAASDINSDTFDDARIAESNVTQHQAALTITESQISDLGSYIENVVDDTSPSLGGDLDASGNYILNLPTPINSTDAANKAYVDAVTPTTLGAIPGKGVNAGVSVTASGSIASIAQGSSVLASGARGSFAQGLLASATGSYGCFAQGQLASATGSAGSFAQGYNVIASGSQGCFAQGEIVSSSGIMGSFAQGLLCTSSGSYGSFAQGYRVVSSGNKGCFAQGYNATATGSNGCFAMGSASTASASGAVIFGSGTNNIAGSLKVTGKRVPFIWQSSAINFKTVADTDIYTIPANSRLVINTFEIISQSVTTPGTAPTVTFGNTSDRDEYLTATVTTSNSTNSRHVALFEQDAISAGATISGSITVASTAATHTGWFIITGYLIET